MRVWKNKESSSRRKSYDLLSIKISITFLGRKVRSSRQAEESSIGHLKQLRSLSSWRKEGKGIALQVGVRESSVKIDLAKYSKF